MDALSMSNLQELIERYCPDGVEYAELGNVCFYPKARVSAEDLGSGGYVSVENLAQNFAGRTGTVIEMKSGTTAIEYLAGDVLVGNIRPYLKKVWLANSPGGTNGDVLVLRITDRYSEVLAPEFLHMLLASDEFIDFDMRFAKGAKMPRGDKKAVLKYRIPLPPIEVQREIVRLLDAYTAAHDALVGKLNEEIELRAKSLAAYRESLLTFSERERVRWVPLGEIATISTGTKPKSEMSEGLAYEYINAGTTASGFVDDWNTDGDTVTTPSRGQGGIGYVGYSKEPFWCGPLCYRIRSIDEGVSNKYIYHALNANRDLILGCMKEGGTPAVGVRQKSPHPSRE